MRRASEGDSVFARASAAGTRIDAFFAVSCEWSSSSSGDFGAAARRQTDPRRAPGEDSTLQHMLPVPQQMKDGHRSQVLSSPIPSLCRKGCTLRSMTDAAIRRYFLAMTRNGQFFLISDRQSPA